MRFLKKKIQRAQEAAAKRSQANFLSNSPTPSIIEEMMLTCDSSFCCPVVKTEFEDVIKMEEDEYQVKIESQFQSNSDGFSLLSSQNVKTEETQDFVKLEGDEYQQIKIENFTESSTERSDKKGKNSKRSCLGPDSRHLSSTKNIAMNYGRAIFSFAYSSLALPYLTPRLEEEGLKAGDFYSFLKHNKTNIQTIYGLRATLLIEDEDDAEMRACKKVFQWIAEVFIKYFSVNWIINGKVSHKMVYLKYRFKMLRRIQNPEKFTFIKERPKKNNKKKNSH